MELGSFRPRPSVRDRSKSGDLAQRNERQSDPARWDLAADEPRGDAALSASGTAKPLRGLYLNERLPAPPPTASALVYANFVTSLDGRIAVADASGISRLPED